MDVADVEGIVGRGNILFEVDNGVVVTGIVYTMVVIANRVIERNARNPPVDKRQILFETDAGSASEGISALIAGRPINIPGHIAQSKGIHLFAGISRPVCVEIIREPLETGNIAIPVGKVHIPQHQYCVVGLVAVRQEFEVNAFGCAGCLLCQLMYSREHTDSGGYVSRRGGDKYVTVRLVGTQAVDSFFVGLGADDSVGNHHTGHSFALAGDPSENASCLSDGRRRVQGFVGLAAADVAYKPDTGAYWLVIGVPGDISIVEV